MCSQHAVAVLTVCASPCGVPMCATAPAYKAELCACVSVSHSNDDKTEVPFICFEITDSAVEGLSALFVSVL